MFVLVVSSQICDIDNDGILNDQELNDFQVKRSVFTLTVAAVSWYTNTIHGVCVKFDLAALHVSCCMHHIVIYYKPAESEMLSGMVCEIVHLQLCNSSLFFPSDSMFRCTSSTECSPGCEVDGAETCSQWSTE